MELQQVQTVVDGLRQTETSDEEMQGAETTVGDAAVALGKLIVDVGGGKHRLVAVAALGAAEAPLDAALALSQLGSYLGIHSKSFLGTWVEKSATLQTPRKSQGFRVFSKKTLAGRRRVRLVKD
jgi:hypothetical protein